MSPTPGRCLRNPDGRPPDAVTWLEASGGIPVALVAPARTLSSVRGGSEAIRRPDEPEEFATVS
jgi:hypothetical protein